MSIEDRITEILEQHFWIEHLEQCSCGETDGKRPWEYGARDYCAHVARVLVTELGLTEELSRSAFPEDAGKRRRYVTPWEDL